MDFTPIKATVAKVPFGNIEIEGLLLDDGSFAIAIPQTAMLFLNQDYQNQASKTFKRLMGKDFKTTKVKTVFNRATTLAIDLVEFERLVAKLDREGNVKAQKFRDDLVGLSLHQLFSDAFKIKFEQEERQEFVKVRQSTLVTRRELTDAIQSYVERHPELSDNYCKFVYSNVADCLNRGLFQKSSKQLCEERNCSSQQLRNTFSVDELRMIEHRESYAVQIIDKRDIEPMAAVKEALALYA